MNLAPLLVGVLHPLSPQQTQDIFETSIIISQ